MVTTHLEMKARMVWGGEGRWGNMQHTIATFNSDVQVWERLSESSTNSHLLAKQLGDLE